MFEGVKHLQDKFICQRKTKKVDAVDTLNVRLSRGNPAVLQCASTGSVPRLMCADLLGDDVEMRTSRR